jgi:DNA-binding NarL/FixJ family response regulator
MKKSLDLKPNATHRRDQWNGSSNRNALSAREREVMQFAIKGLANKEIARELKITEGTVKFHLHRVYQKLGVKSRFALAVIGLPSLRAVKRDLA